MRLMRQLSAASAVSRSSTSASPADFAAFIQEENRFWAKLAKESGAKAD